MNVENTADLSHFLRHDLAANRWMSGSLDSHFIGLVLVNFHVPDPARLGGDSLDA
jgi:hypothetical protein